MINARTRRRQVMGFIGVFVAVGMLQCGAEGGDAGSTPSASSTPAATPAAPQTAPTPAAASDAQLAEGAGPATIGTVEENSCVECHQKPETVRAFPVWARDQFLHWYGAVHGRAGVACEACHHGDATAPAKVDAHQGMLPSRDPLSPVFYKNVPQTCGKCHEAVYEAFSTSDHYRELVSDRLAPSCNTCHGFQMDMGAVTPTQLVARCTVCHSGERGVKQHVVSQARKALDQIAETQRVLQHARVTVDLALEQGVAPQNLDAMLSKAEQDLQKTGIHWHSFRLEAFDSELAGIRATAEEARAQAMQAILQK